jgi:hypothetical protein
MSKRARRNHTPAFKAKVALSAIKGDRTLAHGAPMRRPWRPLSQQVPPPLLTKSAARFA